MSHRVTDVFDLLVSRLSACVWQGAVVGCVMSSAFSLSLAIGTFVLRPHGQSLPTSIELCNRSSSFAWNHSLVAQELWNADSSLMFSTPSYDSEPSWATSDSSAEPRIHQLLVTDLFLSNLCTKITVLLRFCFKQFELYGCYDFDDIGKW